MDDSPFLIAGGGIAGLATSLGLARIGQPSLVLEKAPAFEALGAGLQLGPNAVQALRWLGAWETVAPQCVSPAEIHVRDGLSGKLLQRVALGAEFEKRFGAPYRVAHRADLHNALLQCAGQNPAITLQGNTEIASVSTAETSLTLASSKTLRGKAIIAADGVHSLIRNSFNPAQREPIGNTLYRGLMPTSTVPADINTDVVTLWLFPGGHVVHYAVSNGKQFNIVASVENSAAGFEHSFRRACKPLAGLLQRQQNWSIWNALDIKPDNNWCRNKTLLVGDAAHAALPYLAQGAAMALEDACVLANTLQKMTDIPSAFGEFIRQRFARTTDIQIRSRKAGSIYHAAGPHRLARNAALKLMPQRHFLRRLAWIYDWKALME